MQVSLKNSSQEKQTLTFTRNQLLCGQNEKRARTLVPLRLLIRGCHALDDNLKCILALYVEMFPYS